MGKRVTIPQAAIATGLSEYVIRRGTTSGRFPHIRTSGLGKGRILVDIDLLEAALEREALDSTRPTAAAGILPFGQPKRIAE